MRWEEHRSTRRFLRGALFAAVLCAGCVIPSPSSDLVVTPVDAAEHDKALEAIRAFAAKEELVGTPGTKLGNISTIPPENRRRAEYTTHYGPGYIDANRFVMTLYDVPNECIVIRISDNSGKWSDRTLRAIERLESDLKRATPGRVRMAVPPGSPPTSMPGTPEEHCKAGEKPEE